MELTIQEIIDATKGRLLQGDPHQRVRGVSTDSRSLAPGNIFIALKGNRFDGHQFIGDTLQKGAAAVMVDATFPLSSTTWPEKRSVYIQVEDTLQALGDLASFWAQRHRAKVVAITGSNGKTTTREMVATILSQSYQVLKPYHNFNNLIGLPLTLLRLNPSHQIAIVEMGMNRPGEIERLSRIARPHIGLITNVGPVHLEHFKSIQDIAHAKGELFESLTPEGYAVVNADDPLIGELSTRCPARKVTFGITSSAQIVASEITLSEHGTPHFTLVCKGDVVTVQLKIPGYHNIYNALAAASIATLFSLSLKEIKNGLESFTAFPGRMEILTIAPQIHIINDTYNANPVSMEQALKTLAQLKGKGRGIAVLGDMLELGEASPGYHRRLGVLISTLKLDEVFLIGTYAEIVAESAYTRGMSKDTLHLATTPEEIAHQLVHRLQENDWVLFKGSREMKMEKILEQFLSLRKGGSHMSPHSCSPPLWVSGELR